MKTKNKMNQFTTALLLASSFGLAHSAIAQTSDPRKEISAQIQVTVESNERGCPSRRECCQRQCGE
jgi:hypothetical protein